MKPDTKMITEAISSFFRGELVNIFLVAILALGAILACTFGARIYGNNSKWKAVTLVLLTYSCALLLIVIKSIEFYPVLCDYKNMAYTVEYEAKVCIESGMNNLLEQKNAAVITTQNGNQIKLKITNDYQFETGVAYVGTVVYTNSSKQIVWYDFNHKDIP